MVSRGRGYIINMNSLQGSRGGETSAAYAVSKAALMRFTDTVAAEVAGTGVIVLDVSPGLVRTSMTDERPDLNAIPDDEWTPPETAANHIVALASGKYDALHGRFVHASDNLDDLLKLIEGHTDGRVLRLAAAGVGDPLRDV
jgi:NAD(P)-dependent dehydrogenase (short-subunit alcohol dehydrogenase family)